MTAQGTTVPAALCMGAMCFRDRPFPDIVDAAVASGFSAIGLTAGQCLSALERGMSFEDQAERLTDAGLRVAELELIRLGQDDAIRHANSMVADLSHTLCPDRVHTAAFTGDSARIREDLSALCELLAPLPVAVEFMPYSRIPDLDQAVKLVGDSGAGNARVVLDVVHFFRSGSVPAELTLNHLDAVAVVQLSDVSTRPDIGLATEARHLRTFPGCGSLDIVGLLAAIGSIGAALPPISVEPISDALELLPLPVIAEQIMFSTLTVLDRSDWKAYGTGFIYQGDQR